MNSNRTTLWSALAALTLTLAWTGAATAQSNATDTTFFPMHQGNRWVYTIWDGIRDVGHWVVDIKDPVECVENRCRLSVDDSDRMGFVAAQTAPRTWEPGNTQIEYDVAENVVYYKVVGDTVAVPALYLGKEVGFKWDMGFEYEESNLMLVREVTAVDTLRHSEYGEPIVQYHITQYGAVDGVFWGSVQNASFTFRKGVGLEGHGACLDCLPKHITAARINGQVLFGDITVSDGGDRADVPEGFRLEPAYPNPFNPATTLRFALDRSGDVALEVYDMLGRRMLAQDLGTLQAGEHRHTLDLSGRPSGTYLVRLWAGGQVRTTRVTLLK